MIHRFAIVFVLLSGSPLRAAETTADPKEVAAKADAYMQARMKVSRFSGNILVARDGKTLFAKGYGFANIEHEVPNTPQTKFRLASVSKQFVAAGIMLLEHDGKLKVEDKLEQHLPDCPKAWAEVTLHQLLSHTSGVPENLTPALLKGLWPLPVSLDRLLDIVKDRPLDFKPGEKWQYSNTGYVLLGQIIEKLSGKPYGEFLRERIFDPLGMADTGVDDRRLVLKHRAYNYGLNGKGQPIVAQPIDLSRVYAAGSLYSTVGDLLNWDNALNSEKLLPKKSLDRMWTIVKGSYGYGWLMVDRFDRKIVMHDGGLPGCTTWVTRYPESHVYVAVLCNLEGSPVNRVSYDLAAIALGDPYDVPLERTEVKLDPKALAALVGEYEFQPKFGVTISQSGDALYGRVTGQGRFRLHAEAPAKFFSREPELTVTFQLAENGEPTALILHDNGRNKTAKRLPKEKPPAKETEKK